MTGRRGGDRDRARARAGRAIALAGLVLAVLGCAEAMENRVLPADEQYALAIGKYEDHDYRDAVQAFQTFTFNYPQDPRVVDARWLTAESYYASEDWATAAQEYQNFQRDFPREERADDALFQAGRAYQHMSLRPELDQRDTERAIHVFERLPVEYPRSEFVDEARAHRERLRNKLAEKAYLVAEFYFDEEEYDAAEIYLTDLISQYPDSDWLPAGYALLARTYCAEGLEPRASEVYARLVDVYPDSEAGDRAARELPGACRRTGTSASQ